jgi:hypothetical protein
MEKILVCLNDGLLKIRLDRVLSEKNISYNITTNPIKRTDLLNFSLVIFHSSYKLVNLFKFIENIITSDTITVIYISSNPTSNQFIRFRDNPNLILIDENKMDIEINLAINIYKKLQKNIYSLREQNEKLTKKLNVEKLLSKCKRILINKGFTEETAHKEILKYAMDNKISKEEACNRLISKNN